jgi:hypothetical protein
MNAFAALSAMVAMTEQVVAECDGGTATPERVTALVQERAVHLRDCNPDLPVSPADRTLIERLAILDDQLVRWCADMQRTLEHRRSQIPTAAQATTRLSDIA